MYFLLMAGAAALLSLVLLRLSSFLPAWFIDPIASLLLATLLAGVCAVDHLQPEILSTGLHGLLATRGTSGDSATGDLHPSSDIDILTASPSDGPSPDSSKGDENYQAPLKTTKEDSMEVVDDPTPPQLTERTEVLPEKTEEFPERTAAPREKIATPPERTKIVEKPPAPKPEKPEVEFFQTTVEADSVAYVVDYSSSMSGQRFQRAIEELKRSIGRLKPGQEFYVAFFNQGPLPMFNEPPTSLHAATPRVLARLATWLNSISSQGGTQPEGALQIAGHLKPDVVYLLSDGEFNPISAATMRMFRAHGIKVHTIAFESSSGAHLLKQIAEQTGGTYRFVSANAPLLNIDFADRLTPDNEQRLHAIVSGSPNSWELAHGAGKSAPALMEELFELLREDDSQLRSDVQQVLAYLTGGVQYELPDNASIEVRDSIVGQWIHWFVRESRDGFYNRLLSTGSQDRMRTLNSMVHSPNVHERWAASRYLGSRPDALLDHLLTLVVDVEPEIRSQVKPALVEKAGTDLGPPDSATQEDLDAAAIAWRQWLELRNAEKKLDLAKSLVGVNPQAAQRRLQEIVSSYPGTPLAEEAQALIQEIDENTAPLEESVEVEEEPAEPPSEEEEALAANFLRRAKMFFPADENLLHEEFNKLIERFPGTEAAHEAQRILNEE